MSVIAFCLGLFVHSVYGAAFTEPMTIDLKPNGHVVLEVRQWRFASTPTGLVNFSTRAWCYQGKCSVPGPTLLFHPGTTTTIEVKNTLPTGQSAKPANINSYHSPDTFNIHTHGLHVSPYEDDVHTEVPPQTSRNYTYRVPSYHYEGTHWYHTHYHGNTNYGVSGGLAGMILMQRASTVTGVSADWDAVKSHVVVLQPMSLTTACVAARRRRLGGGNPRPPPFIAVSYCLQYSTMNSLSPNVVWDVSQNANTILVNGQEAPTLAIAPGEWRRLRVLNAGGTYWLELELTGCTMRLLGFDGVFFDTPRTVTYVVMNQGKRADIAIQCQSVGTYTLQTNPAAGRNLGPALRHAQTTLMTIQVSGSAVTMNPPSNPPPKPAYLADTRGLTLASSRTWSLAGGRINNQLFNEQPSYTFNIGSVVHWSIASGWHPYHQHVHHFQLQANLENGNTVIAQAGDWVDVLSGPGTYEMRFHAVTFNGTLTIHCHFLDHEDKGMMTLATMNGASTTLTSSPTSAMTTKPATTTATTTTATGTTTVGATTTTATTTSPATTTGTTGTTAAGGGSTTPVSTTITSTMSCGTKVCSQPAANQFNDIFGLSYTFSFGGNVLCTTIGASSCTSKLYTHITALSFPSSVQCFSLTCSDTSSRRRLSVGTKTKTLVLTFGVTNKTQAVADIEQVINSIDPRVWMDAVKSVVKSLPAVNGITGDVVCGTKCAVSTNEASTLKTKLVTKIAGTTTQNPSVSTASTGVKVGVVWEMVIGWCVLLFFGIDGL